jgi:hypothetical protein
MHNKKAVIGAAMTWLVATLIIIFVVIIFVYASGKLAEQKKIKNVISGSKESVFSDVDVASEKMLLVILESQLDGKRIKDYIIEGNYDLLDSADFKEKILAKLPEPGNDGWDLYILEKNNIIKKIKSPGVPSVGESRVAQVALTSDKKVKFFLDTSYVYAS